MFAHIGVLVCLASPTLRGRPLPGWRWRIGLLLVTLAATWWTHKTLLGRDAGVTLIVVLLALKTLELRARRDAFVVFFLGFFTLLTHFFYSQSLLTAAGILVALLGLLTAVVNAHMPVGHPPLRQTAGIAARLALLGAPIMVLAFLLFPRLSPLWGVPGDGMDGRCGSVRKNAGRPDRRAGAGRPHRAAGGLRRPGAAAAGALFPRTAAHRFRPPAGWNASPTANRR